MFEFGGNGFFVKKWESIVIIDGKFTASDTFCLFLFIFVSLCIDIHHRQITPVPVFVNLPSV